MKIYRYWAREEFELIVAGQKETFVCTGASNDSYDEALKQCEQRAQRIQKIINGEISRESDYEKPIREHLVDELDSNNLITRNRYGALVLNSTSINIFDIDDYRRTFWEWLTGYKFDNKKNAILARLKKLQNQRILPNTYWRIYETTKGIRLIVLGRYIDPSSSEFRKFSNAIGADDLYTHLCVKQGCYRARLTPKPHRIGIKRISFQCPTPQGSEEKYNEWLKEYNSKSEPYSVCKLLQTIGDKIVESPIVEYHDKYCCNPSASELV